MCVSRDCTMEDHVRPHCTYHFTRDVAAGWRAELSALLPPLRGQAEALRVSVAANTDAAAAVKRLAANAKHAVKAAADEVRVYFGVCDPNSCFLFLFLLNC